MVSAPSLFHGNAVFSAWQNSMISLPGHQESQVATYPGQEGAKSAIRGKKPYPKRAAGSRQHVPSGVNKL